MEKRLKIVLVIGFLLRCAVLFVTDLEHVNYYEYGEIAKNIVRGEGFSLFSNEYNFYNYLCSNEHPYSSAFMPPGHVYFLVPFFFIKDIAARSALIIFAQILISTATIYIMYHYVKRFFNKNYAFLAALITALNPEFIYSVKFGTPTVIYHFLLLLVLISLYKYFEQRTFKTLLTAGVLSSLLVYFRSESLLFVVLVWLYFAYKKDYKNLFYYAAIFILLLAPWSIRNYMVFDKPVPLATSFGLNLHRGNNSLELGNYGNSETLNKFIPKLKTQPFEIALNEAYTEVAVNYIASNPIKTLYTSVIKFFDLWVYNMHINKVESAAAMAVYGGFFIIFLLGYIYIFDKSKFILENLVFIMSSISAMIFFVLPRYQTMLHILMMPFCAVGISVIFNYVYNFYKTTLAGKEN